MVPLEVEDDDDTVKGPAIVGRAGSVGGHPKGLWVLAATEVWERFSYYGMRSLLVLYMTTELFTSDAWEEMHGARFVVGLYGEPEGEGEERARSVQILSSRIYGLYTACAYTTPLLGGFVADQYVGQTRMIFLGMALMGAGHFCMAFAPLFFVALALIVLGNGCFKPNVSTQVGRLYEQGDLRRDRGFSLFYVGINVGAFVAPLVCGGLHRVAGFHAGFTAAGAGMLVGMAGYTLGRRFLPEDLQGGGNGGGGEGESDGLLVVARRGRAGAAGHHPPRHLGGGLASSLREHRRVLGGFLVVCALTSVFWSAYEQQGNTMVVYAEHEVDRRVWGGWEMPTEWLQSLNPLLVVALTPPLTGAWRRQAARGEEPSSLAKMGIGCLALSSGYLLLALVEACAPRGAGGGVPLFWVGVQTVFATVGELFLSPVGLSFVTQLSPPGMGSLLMGTWFLASSVGNYLAGALGGLYATLGHGPFFLLVASLAACSGAALLSLRGALAAAMGGCGEAGGGRQACSGVCADADQTTRGGRQQQSYGPCQSLNH